MPKKVPAKKKATPKSKKSTYRVGVDPAFLEGKPAASRPMPGRSQVRKTTVAEDEMGLWPVVIVIGIILGIGIIIGAIAF